MAGCAAVRYNQCVMRRAFCFIFLLSVLVPLTPAQSITASGISVGIGGSLTSGLNISAGYFNPSYESFWLRHFGVRLDASSSAPLKSAIDSAIDTFMRDGRDVGDGVKIDEGKLDAYHGAVLLDFYPFSSWWRITGGYTVGGATLDAAIFGDVKNAPSQRFYFYLAGDHYYYNGNSFDGTATIKWRYHGPYLGTGLDIGLFCGFSLFADVGVVFTSRPAKLTLDVPQEQLYIYNKTSGTWSPVTIPQLGADIARATRDANRKLSDFRLYPVIKLGFAYRF